MKRALKYRIKTYIESSASPPPRYNSRLRVMKEFDGRPLRMKGRLFSDIADKLLMSTDSGIGVGCSSCFWCSTKKQWAQNPLFTLVAHRQIHLYSMCVCASIAARKGSCNLAVSIDSSEPIDFTTHTLLRLSCTDIVALSLHSIHWSQGNGKATCHSWNARTKP